MINVICLLYADLYIINSLSIEIWALKREKLLHHNPLLLLWNFLSSGKHINLRKVTNFCQPHNHLQLLNELWTKVGSLIILLIVIMSHWPPSQAVVSYFMADTILRKSHTLPVLLFPKIMLSSSNFGFISCTIDALFLRGLVIFIDITIICSVLNNNTYFQSFKPQYFPDRLPHISLKRMCWD